MRIKLVKNLNKTGFGKYLFMLNVTFLFLFYMSCSNSNKLEFPDNNTNKPPSLLPVPETIDASDLHILPEDSGGLHRAILAEESDAKYSHFVYTPGGYLNDGPEYPLILFLHGGGQTSNNIENSLAELNKVLTHGPPKLIHENNWNPLHPFIVASPQLVSGEWDANMVHEFIEYLIDRYQINKNRIYITGLSRGGRGTWFYGTFKGNESYAAALVPICGSGNISGVYNLKNIPVWAFHGANDQIISAYLNEGSVPMVNAINQIEPKYKAKVTTFTGVGHDSWTQTYDGSSIGTESYGFDTFDISIYEWMLRFKKE